MLERLSAASPARREAGAARSNRASLSPPVAVAEGSASDVAQAQVLREQVEAEQVALRDRKEEREARRLRRQLELAEAQHELPPPPENEVPPPLATRGRQMSNVI